MDEDDVQTVRAQARKRSPDAALSMLGREIEAGHAVRELLADLGADDPPVSIRADQLAEPFLAGAVGRGGVEQVDAQIQRFLEQCRGGLGIRNRKRAGIPHTLVTPQLDRAEANEGDVDARVAEAAVVHAKSPRVGARSRRRAARDPAGLSRRPLAGR